MKFVHLADLHLDAKFDSLSSIDGLPQKRRLEQRETLKKIIEYINNLFGTIFINSFIIFLPFVLCTSNK